MKSIFDRWLPALTLALWGGAIMIYAFDGRVNGVLQGEFIVYAIIASVLLLAIALVFAFAKLDASCCSNASCGHGLSRNKTGRLLTFLIILLPIILAPTGSKAALDKLIFQNRKSIQDTRSLPKWVQERQEKRLASRNTNAAPAPAPLPGAPDPATVTPPVSVEGDPTIISGIPKPPPPLTLPTKDGSTPPPMPESVSQAPTDWLVRTPDGLIVAEVIDLLYAAQDNTLRADFEGKRIQLIGQYMPDTSKPDSPRFKAVRMFMTCCAADARPVATLVEMDGKPPVKEMEWVRIVGVPSFPIEGGRRVAVLKAERVEKTEAPAEELPPQ